MQSWPTWLVVSTVQVLLQLRLYVLYNRSNKILGFMSIFFLAEMATQVYIYVNFGATTKVSNQPLPGIYFCAASSYGLLSYSVFPTLAFESIVFCLCVWVGYQRSKEHFSAPGLRWSRAHLIDILIKGNVLYYFGFALMWIFAMIAFFVYGLQWGPAVNAFALATFVIGGSHLILHLLEAAYIPPHSGGQVSTAAVFAHPTSTISRA